MDNLKAREFWIVNESPYSTWVSSKEVELDVDCEEYDAKSEVIHVIEYSYAQALETELAEFKWFAKEMHKYLYPGEIDSQDSAIKVFKELKATNERLRKALEFYADLDNWDTENMSPTIWDNGNIDLGKTAKAALEARSGE
jgi:hypothetical protein